MYVFTSQSSWGKSYFFRKDERISTNDESMADDEPVDESTKPVHSKSLEWSEKSKHAVKQKKGKTRRGYGRKAKRKMKENKSFQFSIIGTNAAGLNSKKESFYKLINKFRPSVITIQESKLSRPGMIKIPGYQVFDKERKNKKGGGLLTAADEDIDPVLIETESEDTEIMTIQVKAGNQNIRIINAYGPQEDDETKDVLNFWQEMETEVLKAKDNDCMVMIEMDANAKVGKDVIKDDPNKMTGNGKLLMDMLKRQNLTILNSLDICSGTITRERKVENKIEKSVIDYIVVCENMLNYILEVSVDDARTDVLARYIKTKDSIKVVQSDHNVLFSKFKIAFRRKLSKIRKEIFKFKCPESKKKFKEETSTNKDLSSCFNNKEDFNSCSNLFFRTLNKKLRKCFNKIRIRSGNRRQLGDPDIQERLKLKTELKLFMQNSKCNIGLK